MVIAPHRFEFCFRFPNGQGNFSSIETSQSYALQSLFRMPLTDIGEHGEPDSTPTSTR